MKQNMYKIRDKKSGLYSAGGNPPKWSKKGKIWNSMHALNLHFQLVINDPKIGSDYSDIVIESYKFEYIEDIDKDFFIYKARQKIEERERERQESRERRERKQRWEEYQKLKEEFEKSK